MMSISDRNPSADAVEACRCWNARTREVSGVLMQPIVFNDLKITFLEVADVHHGRECQNPDHRHPWYEFNYISHGSLYTWMEDTEFRAGPGDAFLIPPGVMHGHRHDRHLGDYGLCVRWELERVELPPAVQTPPMAARIMDALSRYQPRAFAFSADTLFENARELSLPELETVFIRWFWQLCRLLAPQSLEAMENGDSRPNSVIRKVLLYLEENFTQPVDVGALADSAGYSYRHLSRLFKQRTGSTIVEKLNGIRIARAITLLETTDMSVGAIAAAVGFHTETYFTTLFGAYTHLAPSHFRVRYGRRPPR